MEKIKFFGFDMDYTLAAYKEPEYEVTNTYIRVLSRSLITDYPLRSLASGNAKKKSVLHSRLFLSDYGTLSPSQTHIMDGKEDVPVGVHLEQVLGGEQEAAGRERGVLDELHEIQ